MAKIERPEIEIEELTGEGFRYSEEKCASLW